MPNSVSDDPASDQAWLTGAPQLGGAELRSLADRVLGGLLEGVIGGLLAGVLEGVLEGF